MKIEKCEKAEHNAVSHCDTNWSLYSFHFFTLALLGLLVVMTNLLFVMRGRIRKELAAGQQSG